MVLGTGFPLRAVRGFQEGHCPDKVASMARHRINQGVTETPLLNHRPE